MANYYCLVAGLPEIQFDDSKLAFNLVEFKAELQENLSKKDYKLIELFFARYDNSNLLRFLNDSEAELDERGNLTSEDFAEIIQLLKEEENPNDERIPSYFKTFVPAYLAGTAIEEGLSWEDQLTSLYNDYALECKNKFVRQYFEFNLNVTNILTAMNCRKFDLPVEEAVVGNNEIAEAIRSSSAKDFGIAPIFPQLQEVMRIADEADLMEKERKLDLIRWNYINEESFFEYFSVEKIVAYLLQIDLLERWMKLSKETGLDIFRKFVQELKGSFKFQEEFSLNR